MTFLTFCVYGQNSHLKISLHNKLTKDAIINKEVTITLNDTLTKILMTDNDGLTIFKLIYGGRYKVKITATGYKPETFKRVGVDDARGRFFSVGLTPQ